ncbi:MAG: site-2 protease family protein [Acidobacteriia bacterium]|nr:site-2 protease family protein [Terriglobia bacterium]
MNEGNGRTRIPVEVLDANYPRIIDLPPPPAAPRRRELWLPLILFLLTVVSTLVVGVEFGRSYAANQEPFSGDANLFAMMLLPFQHPSLLVLGIPFSFTLLAILFAHEMGHYVAARLHGIDVSYPYFIPAPNIFGTFGAFIRIRSPIGTRRALFDVGLAGPVVGFLIAAPALAFGVATSKIVPGAEQNAALVFGHPLLVRLFGALFHPNVDVTWLLLNPVGRAAWVGLFVTALNLLPVWQLDGGHIMYALTSSRHAKISLSVSLILLGLGIFTWHAWAAWGFILLILSLRFRHPPVWDRWQPLDPARRAWAAVALVIFLLCFTPWPAMTP